MTDLDKALAKVSKKPIQVYSPSWCLPPETAAHTFAEALAVQSELDKRYPEYSWHVEDGREHGTQRNLPAIWLKPR